MIEIKTQTIETNEVLKIKNIKQKINFISINKY